MICIISELHEIKVRKIIDALNNAYLNNQIIIPIKYYS